MLVKMDPLTRNATILYATREEAAIAMLNLRAFIVENGCVLMFNYGPVIEYIYIYIYIYIYNTY